MKTLKHVGAGYSGFEPDGKTVNALAGQEIEVSDGKAVQLLADFPTEWEIKKVAEPIKEEEVKVVEVKQRGKK